MRAIVNKVVAKGLSDVSKAPTLTNLLLPRTSRSFTREVEEWLVTHDIVTLMEALCSHLLRTLPHDEIEETDKWLDAQKVSKTSTAAVSKDDVTLVSEGAVLSATHMTYDANWGGQPVTCVVVNRKPSGLSSALSKAHQHCLACMTVTAPQLCTVVHEGVLPTYGYWITDDSVALLHTRVDDRTRLCTLLRAMGETHLTLQWVLQMAQGVLCGLGHMHTLGFLHRNVSIDNIFELHSRQFVIGGFDFTVRSSRGRITSPSWAPRVPAPETLHGRTFETSTDVFAFGVMLCEVCQYGRPMTLPLPISRPAHIPELLWGLIWPCLNSARDARPTCNLLLADVRAAMAGGADALIPHPEECDAHVTTEFLTNLARIGCSPNVVAASDVVIQGVGEDGWPTVQCAIARNHNLEALHVRDCCADASPLTVVDATKLRVLEFCNVRSTDEHPRTFVHTRVRQLISTSCLSLTSLVLSKLSGANDGDALPSFIANLPKWTPQLQSLSLLGLGATSDTFRAVAEALRDSIHPWKALRRLAFGLGDVISSHGMGHLCSGLLDDERVQTLVLDGAVLDYFAVGQLGQLLRETTRLDVVSLLDVDLSACGLRILENALKLSQRRDLQLCLAHQEESSISSS